MNFKIILLIISSGLISEVQSQAPSCNKIPFYPADHIRNPSLEQLMTSCEDFLYADTARGSTLMSSVIPFWQMPVNPNGTVEYFGICNNFHPSTFSNDPGRNFNGYFPVVPQPIPAGRGVIGLTSARSESGSRYDDSVSYKNYISTNLKRILRKDSLYRLDFALGFGEKDMLSEKSKISGSPVRFTLFGLRDSTRIPFQSPSRQNFGCLLLVFRDWVELGSVVITGEPGTWQRAVIDFVPPGEIQSIAIGQGCDNMDVPYTTRGQNELWDYYFIDDLKFFQASAPKPRLSQIGGGSCEGQSTTLRLESNVFYNGSAFQWYKDNLPIPETAVSLTVSTSNYGPGWYKMRVQNDSVCMMTDSVYLEWSPVISDPFAGRPDTTLCMGDVMELKANAGPGVVYQWNTGSTDSSITVTKQGTYTVRISNSCNALNATKTVMYKDCPPAVFVPTAFTPNGDGLNDIFRANASGRIKNFHLSVYDRFGKRIFVSDDPAKGWDGMIKSKQQSAGLYIWMLQYTDSSDKSYSEKGTLLLIR